MNRISVAVVEPIYQINLGYIARAMKNFGATKLYLVNPRCDYTGSKAIQYSKHAREILEGAKVVNSIKRLPKGDMLIGTTGIWHKSEASYYNVYPVDKIGKFAKKKSITILLGRDGTGLTKEELRECDASVFITSNKEYPVLNISHALAVVLYELTKGQMDSDYKELKDMRAGKAHKARAVELFRRIVSSNRSIRDKKGVVHAFEHVLNRSDPTSKEINAIAIALATNIKKGKKEKKK